MKVLKQRNCTNLIREGDTVTITMRCPDRYAAIMLYDQLVAAAKEGGFSLACCMDEFDVDDDDHYDG